LSARLRLELAPSRAMAVLIVVLHAIAAACVMAVLPGPWGAALGAALLALGLASAWTRALLRSGSSVRALELEGSEATLELASGRRLAAKVSERRYVSSVAVALPLGRPLRRTVFVSRDMLGAESFRLLRIWALWGKLPGVAAKQLTA
jgi:hypothetical protein